MNAASGRASGRRRASLLGACGAALSVAALWAPARAAAQPDSADPTAPAASDPVASFRQDLETARTAWFQGQAQVAAVSFQRLYDRLVSGEAIPLDVGGEAAIWLGEIRYEVSPDDARFAEAPWKWLLGRDPDFPISPYQHPADIVGRFEILRGQVKADLASLPPPPPYPAWGWAPFGIPQYTQHQPVRGTVYLIGEVGLAAASIGMYVQMTQANLPQGSPWPGEHPLGWPHGKVTDWLIDRKYLVQWPTTFGFYALWAASTLDGRGHWQHTATTRTPDAGEVGPLPPLVVSGRF